MSDNARATEESPEPWHKIDTSVIFGLILYGFKDVVEDHIFVFENPN